MLAGGLIHRDARKDAEHDLLVQRAAAVTFMRAQAPPEYRRSLPATTTLEMEDDLFRTCTPGDDPDRWFCVYRHRHLSARRDGRPEPRVNDSLRVAGGFR